jgi:hypothetical protein
MILMLSWQLGFEAEESLDDRWVFCVRSGRLPKQYLSQLPQLATCYLASLP